MVLDRFRWAYCQLDTLCRCFPRSIRRALSELPATLDDTYERTLQGIPKEKREDAIRLFQCLVAAIRPLRVQELAEIFAIEFEPETGLNLVEDWRPKNPEEAVLSACSTLISVVTDQDSKIVQFSHFTVKEFLTSDRVQNSLAGNISSYHIPLHSAHTTLVRACLTVLLQLDEKVDNAHLKRFPLALYAAQYWVDHAQFENVVLEIRDAMERLFHPRNAHFGAWIKIHDVARRSKSLKLLGRLPPSRTPLYYAVFCGFTELAKYLIVTHKEDVNARCGRYGTALHAASFKGHPDAARLLLDHGADVDSTCGGEVPLRIAYRGRHLNVMDLLLKRGAKVDMRDDDYIGTILHRASWEGEVEALRLLLQHKANVHARSGANLTPLDIAFLSGHAEVVQLLLEYGASSDLYSQVGAASWGLEAGSSPSDCVHDWGASRPKLPSLLAQLQGPIVMARPYDGAILVCERPVPLSNRRSPAQSRDPGTKVQSSQSHSGVISQSRFPGTKVQSSQSHSGFISQSRFPGPGRLSGSVTTGDAAFAQLPPFPKRFYHLLSHRLW